MQLDKRQTRHLITRFFLMPCTMLLFFMCFAGYYASDEEGKIVFYELIMFIIVPVILIISLTYILWKLEFKGANVLFLFQIYLEIVWLRHKIDFANAVKSGNFYIGTHPIACYIIQGLLFLCSSFLAIDAIIYYIKKWLKYIEERKSVKRIQKLLNKK